MVGVLFGSCVYEQGWDTQLPLTALRRKLNRNLVGQSLAIETIISNLSVYSASKPSRPLVLWLSGREGSGKSLTIRLMRKVLGAVCEVQSVYPTHPLHDTHRLQQQAATLIRQVNPGACNFLTIDGWDGESSALALLDMFLAGLLQHETLRNSSVLVALSGTRGGQEVEQYFGGAERERRHDFTTFSLALQEKHSLSRLTPTAALVPFLPLDAGHVKRCVTRELLKRKKFEVLLDEAALTRLEQQVLKRTKLEPAGANRLPLAAHGCKRVPALLTLLLPDLQEGP